MDMSSYDEGRSMELFGVAWRIKGIHEIEGLISYEARAKIFDFLRKEASAISPATIEGIDKIDNTKVKP